MISFPEKKSLIKLRNGNRIGYAVYGNKKNFPIFYFHGWPGSRFELKNIPLKKEKCFIIALERPGYGISDSISNFKILDWPKIVLEIANKLKIKKFSIIGVSGGAPFALACANAIKNNILKAIAVVCPLAPSEVEGMNKGRVGMLINYGKRPLLSWLIINLLRMSLLNNNIKKNFNRLKNKIPLPKADLKLLTVNRGKKLMENYKEAVKHGITGVHRDAYLYSNDWGFKLKNIKRKIFIWHGEKDLTVPIITNKYYKKKLKNKKIFIKSNEGHFSICYNFMNNIIQQVSG
jgi:pimeloyl-ACP methyl ester carboxylesterase